jgi:hypothetical protein
LNAKDTAEFIKKLEPQRSQRKAGKLAEKIGLDLLGNLSGDFLSMHARTRLGVTTGLINPLREGTASPAAEKLEFRLYFGRARL